MEQYRSSINRLQTKLHFLLVIMFSVLLMPAKAQNNNKPVYASFIYLKTNPGKYNDYLNLAKTYSKKFYEHQFRQRSAMGWYLYEVLMPTGAEADYNFVSVVLSDNIQQLLDPSVGGRETMQKINPQMTTQQLDSLTGALTASRNMVKREIYQGLSGTDEDAPPTKYAEIDFMTPVQGKEADYAKMEVDKFLPVHKQRMMLGAVKGWRLAQKVLPASTDDPYPYITANFFDDISTMMDGKYEQAIKKALPNQDLTKLVQYMNSVKKGQKNELWKLVDYSDQHNTK